MYKTSNTQIKANPMFSYERLRNIHEEHNKTIMIVMFICGMFLLVGSLMMTNMLLVAQIAGASYRCGIYSTQFDFVYHSLSIKRDWFLSQHVFQQKKLVQEIE